MELGDRVGYQLRRAQLAVFAHFNHLLSELDVRPAEFSLLDVVDREPGILQTHAAAALGIQKANFVPFVGRLERRGLIVRVPLDGRSNGLRLTPAGRALLRRARRLVDAHDAAVTKGLSKTRRRLLTQLLAHVTAQAEAALTADPAAESRSA